MSDGTAIEWTRLPGFTPATWNPIAGCTPISPGCKACYAASMARRLEAMGQAKYAGTAERRGKVDVFTGRINFDDPALAIPLNRRKPTCYFVNSMSDLFHEDVPFEFIDRVFAVMALSRRHTFQVLTKRPERMAEYMAGLQAAADSHAPQTTGGTFTPAQVLNLRNLARDPYGIGSRAFSAPWPLPNVWLGTSVENADYYGRIDELRKVRAAVRFLSLEPLLGPLDLSPWLDPVQELFVCQRCGEEFSRGEADHRGRHPYCGGEGDPQGETEPTSEIHWAIFGCESGPKRRPCETEWIADALVQCREAGVPAFVKQLSIDGRVSKDPSEWPEALRVREFPAASPLSTETH